MRFSGTIFLVSMMFFTLLCLAWFIRPASVGVVDGVADMQGANEHTDRIQQILSGDVKRAPKKNIELGAGRLRGRVFDGVGTLMAGVTIQVTPTEPDANIVDTPKAIANYWESVTDPKGRFAFRTLPGGRFLVSATLEGLQAVALAEVVDGGAFQELELVLSERAVRRGVILDPEENPIVGARVVPLEAPDWSGDSAAYRYVTATSTEKGMFQLSLLPLGAWEVLVVAPDFAPQRVALANTATTIIRLGEGGSLQGRLLSAANQRPMNNMRVVATMDDIAGESSVMRSNGQGFFSFHGLRPGSYRVHVDNDRYIGEATGSVVDPAASRATASTPESRNLPIDPLTGETRAPANDALVRAVPKRLVDDGSTAALTLMVHRASSIRGRILEAGADFGIPGVRVEAFRPGERQAAAHANSDLAGYYHLMGLVDGPYTLAIPGTVDQVFVAEEGTNVVVEGGTQSPGPVFRVAVTEKMEGRVTDSRGVGVVEANVFLRRSSYPGAPRSAVTIEEGHFRLSGVHADEEIAIWAERLGNSSEVFGPVTVGAGGFQGIQLTLDRD